MSRVAVPTAGAGTAGSHLGALKVVGAGVGLWVVQRLLVILGCLATGERPPRDFMKWDGRWYERIARTGYHVPHPRPGDPLSWSSDLAFFPGLPAIGRFLARCGVAPSWATLVAAWVGFLGAAVVIVLVGREVGGDRVGVLLVLLWGVAPMSFVQILGYSEGWFIACLGLGLLMALRRNWIRAGLAICVAGLFRPAVVPAGVLLGLAWVAAWPVFRQGVDAVERRRRFIGAALTPWGILGYAALVAARVGRWDAYLMIQTAWGTHVGWSNEVFRLAAKYWPIGPYNWRYFGLVIVAVVVYLVLLLVMIATREKPLLWAHVALFLLLAVFTVGFFRSKARFLLPAFPAFLPVARLLAKVPPWVTVVAMVLLTGLSSWWGVYMVGSKYSP